MFRKSTIIAALLLLSSCGFSHLPGFIQGSDYRDGTAGTAQNILEAQPLNAAAAADRTITLATAGFTRLRVFVFFTHVAATTVTAALTCSYDGTTYASITSRAVSAGLGTVDIFTDSNAVAGDEDFILEYAVAGCKSVKVVFSGAAAGATDLVDVQAIATVGGG